MGTLTGALWSSAGGRASSATVPGRVVPALGKERTRIGAPEAALDLSALSVVIDQVIRALPHQ